MLAPAAASTRRAAIRRVPIGRTVWALGFTSLLTDVSSEMVSSILPVYLVLHLGMTPWAFGVIDGLYHGIAAVARLASGVFADRRRRHKEVAAAGYALSAICRLGVLAAGTGTAMLGGVVALDRIGKGIRTAPRDALIAMDTPREHVGTAFGVHRALDAIGALLGPLVAFGLLFLVPRGFDLVFVASFCLAVMGLSVLLLFVDARVSTDPLAHEQNSGNAWRLLAGRPFRSLVIVAAMFGITAISDGFLYLLLQRQVGFNAAYFPLLYVATSLFNAAAAVPLGRLADRVGRTKVYLAGYVLLLSAYALLFVAGGGIARVLGVTALLGTYYAATDGILAALASQRVPRSLAGSGLALLGTTQNIARLAGSVAFGWAWTQYGGTPAVTAIGVGLTLSVICAALMLRDPQQLETRHG